jgi:hypothetical protein
MWEYINSSVGRQILGATPESFAGVLLPLLLDAGAKATVILALAMLASRMLRRSSAATRHTIWLLAAVSLVALPVLTVMVPAWQVLPRWMNLHGALGGQIATLPREGVGLAAAPVPSDEVPPSAPWIGPGQGLPEVAAPTVSPQPSASAASMRQDVSPAESSPQLNPATVACLIWLAGVAVVLARMLLGMLSLLLVRRAAQPVIDQHWLDSLEQTWVYGHP